MPRRLRRRLEEANGLSDRFRRPVAVNRLRASVPRAHRTVRTESDDRFETRLDEKRELFRLRLHGVAAAVELRELSLSAEGGRRFCGVERLAKYGVIARRIHRVRHFV